jgi:hypothetical protein
MHLWVTSMVSPANAHLAKLTRALTIPSYFTDPVMIKCFKLNDAFRALENLTALILLPLPSGRNTTYYLPPTTFCGCPFRLRVFCSVHHSAASLRTDMAFLLEQEEIREWECVMESRLSNAVSAVAVFPPGVLLNLQTLKTNSVHVLEWLPPLLPIRHLRIVNLSSLTYTHTTGTRASRKGTLAVGLAALGRQLTHLSLALGEEGRGEDLQKGLESLLGIVVAPRCPSSFSRSRHG